VNYTGVYINLDRSTARRAAMEAELAGHGLADCYRRFPAADGNVLGIPTTLTDREMGCLTSHYLVCKDHHDCPTHLHVVEDDAVFSRLMAEAIRTIISPSLIERYDILFLDGVIDPLQAGLPFRHYKGLYDQCVVRDDGANVIKVNFRPIVHVATTTSYLVNGRSIRKLLAVYESVLARPVKDPIDILIRNKGQAGALRVACLFPFLTSVRLEDATTIAGRRSDELSVLAVNLSRRSFFVDRDIGALLDYADKALPPPTADPHTTLLNRLSAFYQSPEFRRF
jgi:GR25 family glycosyltransferase involved in LPS biosynthesis